MEMEKIREIRVEKFSILHPRMEELAHKLIFILNPNPIDLSF